MSETNILPRAASSTRPLNHHVAAPQVVVHPHANATTSERRNTHFVHTALNSHLEEFRLLRIMPAKDQDDHLEIRMETASLKNSPRFAALSYLWGKPAETHSIVCNGELMQIPKNSYHVLSSMRGTLRGHKLFWMDSLCINQRDMDEKSSMIKLMPNIFRTATETFCCLVGGKSDTLETARPLLAKLATLSSEFIGVHKPSEGEVSSLTSKSFQASTAPPATSIFHGQPKISPHALDTYNSKQAMLEHELLSEVFIEKAWDSIQGLVNDDYFSRSGHSHKQDYHDYTC
jgi:hypothetical protein